MNSDFWTNTIWYVILGLITVLEIVYFMSKSENRSLTLAFYLTILGITLNFETIILIFLEGYTYYPKLLQNPPIQFHDVLAGNLFSQFSVSATIVLATVLNLRYYWYFILAGIYGLIETLFLALGIYSHNWYQTWMTVVLLTLSFWLAKIIYLKIIKGVKPIYYYGYIYLGLFPLDNITLNWGLMLTRHIDYSTTLFSDPIHSRFFIVWFLFNLLAFSCIVIHFLRLNKIYKFLMIAMLYFVYYIGYRLNLIWIKEGWFLLLSTASILWMYLSVVIMDQLYKSR
ncbi:hypothetical protein [Desulfosporosinus youngiae]|uniref:Uncharacterized protein n=1 Tax=Desulfosporosinus youngiae DSM 17734 TaxID=768710 RepID=H5XRL3_9FIRM|nr:hypothetical protein [Desulfosporosinus youngiae]EHQ87272.1 hypothetical protein DesyoDRAFT_0040 [Desulfosporosinus youngiae DSM 17734]